MSWSVLLNKHQIKVSCGRCWCGSNSFHVFGTYDHGAMLHNCAAFGRNGGLSVLMLKLACLTLLIVQRANVTCRLVIVVYKTRREPERLLRQREVSKITSDQHKTATTNGTRPRAKFASIKIS